MARAEIGVTRRDVWLHMLLYPRHTLPTAAAPVLVAVGLALGNGVFVFWPALAAFLSGWFIQLGGVITDNYLNLKRHPHDREHALFVQALNAQVITCDELKKAIYACYTLALLTALYLVYVGGMPVIWIGLASIAASLVYSAGPFPLGDITLRVVICGWVGSVDRQCMNSVCLVHTHFNYNQYHLKEKSWQTPKSPKSRSMSTSTR